MADEELTMIDAAALIGVTDSALRRAIQRGRLAARRIGARVLVVRREDVLAYAASRQTWRNTEQKQSETTAPSP